jgi:hypothetical protein
MNTIYEPLNDFEFCLLEYIYQDVKLPVIELPLQPSRWTRKNKNLYDTVNEKFITRPTLLLSADDGKPSESFKAIMQTNGDVNVKDKSFSIETQLDDAWQLNFEIKSDIPVERVRLGKVPAFQDANNAIRWKVILKMFADNIRREFLEDSLFIQLSNGYRIKCFLPFS